MRSPLFCWGACALQAAARGGPSRRGCRSYRVQDALDEALAFYRPQCGNQCLHDCGANFGFSFHTSAPGRPGRLWVNMRCAWLQWMSSSAPIRVGTVRGVAVLVAMFSIASCAYGTSASDVFGIFSPRCSGQQAVQQARFYGLASRTIFRRAMAMNGCSLACRVSRGGSRVR